MNNSSVYWLFYFLVLFLFMANPIKSITQFSCASSQDKNMPQISLTAAQYYYKPIQCKVPVQYKIQKTHFLFDCSNKQKCKEIALQCNAALVAAQKQGNQEQINRLEKRLQALNSKDVKTIHRVLYQEFDGALESSAALVRQFSRNIHAYVAHGIAVATAQKAEVEKDLGMVCSYADVVHDLVTIAKVATGAVRGACRGIKLVMTYEHAKQLVRGTAHFVKAMAQRAGEFIELAPVLGDVFCSGERTIAKFEQDNPAALAAMREHCNAQFKLLQETPWEKIAEVGAELGTILLLDTVIFHGAGLAASTAGRKFVAEVATILEEGGAALKAYSTDVAIIGKAAATESEVLGAVLKEFEAHPKILVEGEVSIGTILKEEIETKLVWNYIKPTEDMYVGIKIPRSFEITVGEYKLWVHPGATKHMEDYIIRTRIFPHMSNLDSQILLKSFYAAVGKAVKNGIPKYGEEIIVGDWELAFGEPRNSGKFPTIYHANYRPFKL